MDKKDTAREIASIRVERRLASCVQVLGPIKSTYWWKGNIEKAMEWMLIIKTKMALYNELEDAIKSVHPYDIPEIIVSSIDRGSSDYLKWIEDEVK
ncbi:MAG: divalent-cation tolerance protein CutA [bacterium]